MIPTTMMQDILTGPSRKKRCSLAYLEGRLPIYHKYYTKKMGFKKKKNLFSWVLGSMVALALDLHCVSEATEPAEATRVHLVASRRSKTGHLKLWERIIEVASWQQCSAYFRFFNTFIWGLKSDY